MTTVNLLLAGSGRRWRAATQVAFALCALLAACGPVPGGGGAAGSIQYPRFAYVSDGHEGVVSMYQVLAPTGQLRPLGYAPVSAKGLLSVGDWMVVEHSGSSQLFRVDAASGFLALSASTDLPQCPFPVLASVTGEYVFCVSFTSPTQARAFRLDQQSGSVKELGSAPITGESLLAVDPPLRFMLARLDSQAPRILPIKLNLGAAANQVVAGSPWTLPGPPLFVAMAPSGRWAYVGVEIFNGQVDTGWSLLTYAMNPDGTPDGAPLQTLPMSSSPFGGRATLTAAGTEMFVVDRGNTLSILIDATTGLVGTPVASHTFGSESPNGMAADPAGRFVYVTTDHGGVSVLDARSGQVADAFKGAWEVGAVEIKTGPEPVTTFGKFLLVSVSAGALSSFAIDPTNGTLTHVGVARTGSPGATKIATSPDGRFAYVISAYSPAGTTLPNIGAVTAFAIDPTGQLKVVGVPVPLSGVPRGIAVDRASRQLFVTVLKPPDSLGERATEISVFTLDPPTGMIGATLPPIPLSLTAPGSLAVSNTGDLLLVTDARGKGELDLFATRPTPTGQFKAFATSVTFPTGTTPPPTASTVGAVFDPFDRFIASWGDSNQLWLLNNGKPNPAFEVLTTMSLGSATTKLNALAPSFDGKRVFALEEDVSNQRAIMAGFGVDVQAGTFASQRYEVPAEPIAPVAACADPVGQWFYVLDGTGQRIFLYDRDTASGDLPAPAIPGQPGGPWSKEILSRQFFAIGAGSAGVDMQIVTATH